MKFCGLLEQWLQPQIQIEIRTYIKHCFCFYWHLQRDAWPHLMHEGYTFVRSAWETCTLCNHISCMNPQAKYNSSNTQLAIIISLFQPHITTQISVSLMHNSCKIHAHSSKQHISYTPSLMLCARSQGHICVCSVQIMCTNVVLNHILCMRVTCVKNCLRDVCMCFCTNVFTNLLWWLNKTYNTNIYNYIYIDMLQPSCTT